MEKINKVIAFTDGSCNVHSPQKLGGWAVFMMEGGNELWFNSGYKNTTISRMEMMAVLNAITCIPTDENFQLTIYSDSQFVVKSIKTGLVMKWRANGWKGVKNSDLWIKIVRALEERPLMTLKLKWTKGHRKNLLDAVAYGNACADALADYKIQEEYKEDLAE